MNNERKPSVHGRAGGRSSMQMTSFPLFSIVFSGWCCALMETTCPPTITWCSLRLDLSKVRGRTHVLLTPNLQHGHVGVRTKEMFILNSSDLASNYEEQDSAAHPLFFASSLVKKSMFPSLICF